MVNDKLTLTTHASNGRFLNVEYTYTTFFVKKYINLQHFNFI